MYLKYFIAWFGIVVLELVYAAIRRAVYTKYVSELAAHYRLPATSLLR